MNQDKIKRKEKLSYALINFGNIPVMTLINSYLLVFYTNICGLDPAACATLFLIARILDGLNDPLVGYVIDHLPNTKMGHFRPPLIVGTILVSINFLLLWFGPLWAPAGKLVIAYISYILLGILFPVMDISLNSLLPVMTADMKERDSLSSIKGLIYALGAIIIGIGGPLILGDANNKKGYIILVIISVAMIFIFSIVGTLGVKERIHPQKNAEKYKVKDLFFFLTRRPVLVTFLAVLFATISNNVISAANTYFYTYIYGDLSISALVSLVMCVTLFPATVLVVRFSSKYGKKKMYLVGLLIAALAPLVRLLDVRSAVLLILSTLITGIGNGFIAPLNYSLQADNTDYIELESGMRAEGAISSLSSFISKCAMGIGGAIPGYMLAAAGFNPALSAQSNGVNTVILLCVIIIPAAIYIIGVILFGLLYPLTQSKLQEMNEALAQRRAAQKESLS